MTSRIIADFLTAFGAQPGLFSTYTRFCAISTLRRGSSLTEEAGVAEFSMASPNNGFMGFPVAMIFFGETGLLLMLAHNAAMNFLHIHLRDKSSQAEFP